MNNIEQVISLLQQLVDSAQSHNEVVIAIVTTVAAVSGTLIGALVTYFTTNLQVKSQLTISNNELRANTISRERLEWLELLRNSSVSFMGDTEMLFSMLQRPGTIQQNIDPLFVSTIRQAHTIQLMLNPDKLSQMSIIEAINEYSVFISTCVDQRNTGILVFDKGKMVSLKSKMMSGLWDVGKQTWDKIKELK